jgi:hypothetical protein
VLRSHGLRSGVSEPLGVIYNTLDAAQTCDSSAVPVRTDLLRSAFVLRMELVATHARVCVGVCWVCWVSGVLVCCVVCCWRGRGAEGQRVMGGQAFSALQGFSASSSPPSTAGRRPNLPSSRQATSKPYLVVSQIRHTSDGTFSPGSLPRLSALEHGRGLTITPTMCLDLHSLEGVHCEAWRPRLYPQYSYLAFLC